MGIWYLFRGWPPTRLCRVYDGRRDWVAAFGDIARVNVAGVRTKGVLDYILSEARLVELNSQEMSINKN